MRIALDANVIVSALLNVHGDPAQVLDLVRQGFLTPCVDGRMIGEYEEVLVRPEFPFAPEDVSTLVKFLRDSSEFVAARPLAHRLPDPDDEAFLEVAAEGRVDALVTGNTRHFPDDCRAGVPVMSPIDLISLIRREGPGSVRTP